MIGEPRLARAAQRRLGRVERRLYHRKDGQIVKLQDDLLSATRYAWVMRRYASVPPDPHKQTIQRDRNYDWRAG